jgi:hypothetical protein
MAKLKNLFHKYKIRIECDGKKAKKSGDSIKIKLNPAKYKSIRIKKKKGDWPERMKIFWDKDAFDFIFPEIIKYNNKNEEKFSIPPEYREEIDDFEIQIKINLPNERDQEREEFTDPGTTVTIGDAPPGNPPVEKKKKG